MRKTFNNRQLAHVWAQQSQPEGPRVGAFTLREVTADGALVIGCHRLEADELERIAGELGVTA